MISRLKDTLLLVGDSASDRAQLRTVFEPDYNLLEAAHVAQAQLLLEHNLGCIAAVLADIPLDRDEISALVKASRPATENEVPVILFAPSADAGEQEEVAFALGVTDVVRKPYTPSIIRRRVHVLVDLYLHRWHLETLVAEQNETIRNSNQVMIDALSAIIEHRNTESGNHVLRIRRFTKILLEEVARSCPEYGLDDTTIERIASASALHDIGKISIPDAILNKPDKLTDEEFDVMKTHTTVGSRLVENLSGMSDVDYLRYAYNIALYHHERWDGQGYPCRLKGDDIPICAQAVGLADAYDALTTPRVYKPAFSCDKAINMILNGECGAFSPRLLECFKHVRSEFVELTHNYADGYSPKSDGITVPLPTPVWHKPRLDSLQLSQVKYQTLLHYANDTVIEFDLDNRLYHVVYNPNPDFETLFLRAPFDEVTRRLIANGCHPEDREMMQDIRDFVSREFFAQNLRKKAFACRMYSPALSAYVPYEITLLRVNTQNTDQRILIAVFHRGGEGTSVQTPTRPDTLHASPALYGLVSSTLRCRSDRAMTIDAGAGELYPLTGYSPEEIQQLFDGQYLNLVLPEDREAFARAMQDISTQGGHRETEYRLLRKDGSSVWVLTKSRAYLEADGQEYIYHAIRDNCLVKEEQQRLQADLERTQLVLDQTDAVVFEWDPRTDTLRCSENCRTLWGYTPRSEGYSAHLGSATRFHPDDLAFMRSQFAILRSGGSAVRFEVRLANGEGRYLWHQIRAVAQHHPDGSLRRIVGLVSNINDLKQAEQDLKEQAERDALTTLLNKASTQQLVSSHLAAQDPQTLSALLVLDLDNFKAINDRCGHLYGDAVLAKVGTHLKRFFRSHDIIGRIGGDEFLVYLHNIPDEQLLHDRCRMFVSSFRTLLEAEMPDLDVSCSVGAAIAPLHGSNYAELFHNADTALYAAKLGGKNTYQIYSVKEDLDSLMERRGHELTRIDSDEDPGLASNSFVRFVFHKLYESRDVDATVREILSYIGEQFGISRAYVFENNEDNTTCSNTFEWCNEGIPPEIDHLQNINYDEDIPGWREMFAGNGLIYCPDVTQFPDHIRAIVEPQGIKSMLLCAIMDGSVFRGYVGFDECTNNRLWTQPQIAMLQFLAEVVAMFLLKKRSQDRTELLASNLRSVLDSQDAWIYVIDPDTCELKFLNHKIRTLAPTAHTGMTCYKALMNRECRCENCPAANIRQTKNAAGMVTAHNLGVRAQVRAAEVQWTGEALCLMTCYDASQPIR